MRGAENERLPGLAACAKVANAVASPARSHAIDVLRGLTVALMIIVNYILRCWIVAYATDRSRTYIQL